MKAIFVRGSFLNALFLLMSGNLLAQLIGMGAAPIISRLYDPSVFGQFAQFAALLTLCSVAATLRYEDAIMLPTDPREAFALLLISVASVVFLSVLVLTALLVSLQILSYNKLQINPILVWALPLGMCVAGLVQAINGWRIRIKEFRGIANNNVLRSSSAAVSKIGFGFVGFGVVGLIVGQILGELISLTQAARSIFGTCRSHAIGHTFKSLWYVGKKYSDISIYGSIQILIAAAWIQLPVVFIAHFYGNTEAGYYAMALVLIKFPVTMFQNALRQVFYQRITAQYNNGLAIFHLVGKVTASIYLAYLVPALVIFFWARELCEFVFGEQWRVAGDFAQILVVSSFISIAKVPAVALTKIFRVQRTISIMDFFALMLQISIFFIAADKLTIYQIMVMHAVIIAAYNIALIVWMLGKSYRHDKMKNSAS